MKFAFAFKPDPLYQVLRLLITEVVGKNVVSLSEADIVFCTTVFSARKLLESPVQKVVLLESYKVTMELEDCPVDDRLCVFFIMAETDQPSIRDLLTWLKTL